MRCTSSSSSARALSVVSELAARRRPPVGNSPSSPPSHGSSTVLLSDTYRLFHALLHVSSSSSLSTVATSSYNSSPTKSDTSVHNTRPRLALVPAFRNLSRTYHRWVEKVNWPSAWMAYFSCVESPRAHADSRASRTVSLCSRDHALWSFTNWRTALGDTGWNNSSRSCAGVAPPCRRACTKPMMRSFSLAARDCTAAASLSLRAVMASSRGFVPLSLRPPAALSGRAALLCGALLAAAWVTALTSVAGSVGALGGNSERRRCRTSLYLSMPCECGGRATGEGGEAVACGLQERASERAERGGVGTDRLFSQVSGEVRPAQLELHVLVEPRMQAAPRAQSRRGCEGGVSSDAHGQAHSTQAPPIA